MIASRDKNNIFNLYLEAVAPAPTTPQNISPEDQKKLADFFVDVIAKLEQGDAEAEKLLSMSPQQILQYIQSQQGVQKEAFENIRSKIGGAMSGTGPAQKRYELLLNTVKQKIWEMGKDIQNTKDKNSISQFDNLVKSIQGIEPSMVPEGGTFQKIAYGAGKVAGTIGKIATVGAIGSSLASVGLPAATVGGIIGGGMSVFKNSANTNMSVSEKLKKALIAAGIGAVSGYAMGKLREVLATHHTSSDNGTTDGVVHHGQSDHIVGDYDVGSTLNNGQVTITHHDPNAITVETRVRIPTSLGHAKGIEISNTRSSLYAKEAIANALGTDQMSGVSSDTSKIVNGYLVRTYSWSTKASDMAQ